MRIFTATLLAHEKFLVFLIKTLYTKPSVFTLAFFTLINLRDTHDNVFLIRGVGKDYTIKNRIVGIASGII